MNDYDKNNLMFLLNSSKERLAVWSKTVTEDDIDYAMELLRTYSAELTVREMEVDEETGEFDVLLAAVELSRIMKM